MRLLVTLTHKGRGSCPKLWLLDEKAFLEIDSLEITSQEEQRAIWKDDKRLLEFMDGDEIVSIAVVEITVFDKWLIVFDQKLMNQKNPLITVTFCFSPKTTSKAIKSFGIVIYPMVRSIGQGKQPTTV
jgi:hypothetical protein